MYASPGRSQVAGSAGADHVHPPGTWAQVPGGADHPPGKPGVMRRAPPPLGAACRFSMPVTGSNSRRITSPYAYIQVQIRHLPFNVAKRHLALDRGNNAPPAMGAPAPGVNAGAPPEMQALAALRARVPLGACVRTGGAIAPESARVLFRKEARGLNPVGRPVHRAPCQRAIPGRGEKGPGDGDSEAPCGV